MILRKLIMSSYIFHYSDISCSETYLGELSLDGSLQPVKGVLPIALKAKEERFKGIIVSQEIHMSQLLLKVWTGFIM